MITVTIPVGPYPANRRWLDECVESVFDQTDAPDEILFIDDQADIDWPNYVQWWRERLHGRQDIALNWWETPWLSGVAHASNFGVALARNEYVVMLGSDDKLQPWALTDLKTAIAQFDDPYGYYYFDVEYMDNGETQNLPCHAAAVTKALWNRNGGFPVEAAIGAPDTMLISIMLGNAGRGVGKLLHVDSKAPPYLYRRHQETDTALRRPFDLGSVRNILTATWPEWVERWRDRK